IRRRFVPIADTVAAVQAALRPGEETLVQGLRRELGRLGEVAIPVDAFDRTSLPAHLRSRFRVLGADGAVVAEGEDLAALKEGLAEDARRTIAAAPHPLEQTGLTSWALGDLPLSLEVGETPHRATAYPALVDEGDSVAVRLLPTTPERDAAMRPGICRLLLLSLPSPELILRPMVDRQTRQTIRTGPYEDSAGWIDDCLMAAAASIVDRFGDPPRHGADFERLRATARDDLAEIAIGVGEQSLGLLGEVEEIEVRLGPVADRYPDTVDDVVAQVNRLVYPGFLMGIGAARIADVSRYLRAVTVRLDALAAHPDRDADQMARVHRLESEYDRLADLLPTTPESIEIAWMLEELRVSLFAQAVGTRGKVSEPRIERALAALEA
ncbi:MAG: DUF3418 domain-containing protein, partial [Acidimicrobiia bacterium]|nr:DUF3418 domain-containing protein [Acidimicrobiia bacterium]